MGLLTPRRDSSLLNNNSSLHDHNNPPGNRQCHLGDLDNLIQDQYDILSRAVENILAVSSEDIFHGKVSERKESSESKEKTEEERLQLVEDVDFKEALDKFSEETLSMSSENILKNCSKSQSRKYLNRSLKTFPIIDEGRSPNLYLILI